MLPPATRRAGALFLAVAFVCCGRGGGERRAASPAAGPAPPSLALVVVDTLRADHVGAYGYERATTPAVDRWFGRGLVFESAYTPVPFTAPAVMSLLTGLYPEHHRVRMVFQRLPPDRLVLPQYLKRAGYHTAAVVSNMVLTDDATGLGGRFDYFDDFVDESVRWSGTKERPAFERTAERTTDAALLWLQKARALGKPLFLWLHYMDPHGPYTPPSQPFSHAAPVPIDPNRVPAYNRQPGLTDGAEFVDRYDGEIAHADRAIARFLEAWEREFPLERSVVAFTADHGETLMEAGRELWFTHGFSVWQEQARVPLMLAGRGVPKGRRAEPVSLLDVVPTLLAAAGLPAVRDLDGRSLLDPGADREIHIQGMGRTRGKQFRALVKGARKWVIYSEAGVEQPGQRRLFDLRGDPGEQHPAAWPEGEAARLPTLFAALWTIRTPPGFPPRKASWWDTG